MSGALATPRAPWRAWLLSDQPTSAAQAALGRAYLSWLALARKPRSPRPKAWCSRSPS